AVGLSVDLRSWLARRADCGRSDLNCRPIKALLRFGAHRRHYIELPGSQRQRFFLVSHHTAESMICDSTALMTKIGGFFLLMSIRPTSNVSNGTLIRTNFAFGVAACHASLPLPKITRKWCVCPGSALKVDVILGLPKPKYAW